MVYIDLVLMKICLVSFWVGVRISVCGFWWLRVFCDISLFIVGIKKVKVLFDFVFDDVIIFLFWIVGSIVCFWILVSVEMFFVLSFEIILWWIGKLVISKKV